MEIQKLKQLRDKTGASISLCREALEKSAGDMGKAEQLVTQLLSKNADKRAEGKTGSGSVAGYIHHDGRIGVLVELRAQTDFVTRGEEFRALAKEVAAQIAANNPAYIKKEDIPADATERQQTLFAADIGDKPKDIADKIVTGRLQKWYEEVCLLNQRYFKDETQTIEGLVKALSGKVGEKIEIARFVRYDA